MCESLQQRGLHKKGVERTSVEDGGEGRSMTAARGEVEKKSTVWAMGWAVQVVEVEGCAGLGLGRGDDVFKVCWAMGMTAGAWCRGREGLVESRTGKLR